MMKYLLLCTTVLAAANCSAQWWDLSGLAVDGQGQVYITTRLAPPDAALTGGDVRVYAAGRRGTEVVFDPPQSLQNPVYGIRTQVSAEGNTFAYSMACRCCGGTYSAIVEVRTPFGSSRITRPGNVELSRNGKWALFRRIGESGPADSLLWEIGSGQQFPLAEVLSPFAALSDEGAVVRPERLAIGEGLRVYRRGKVAAEVATSVFGAPVISGDGSTVIFPGPAQTGTGLGLLLWRVGAPTVSRIPLKLDWYDSLAVDSSGSRAFALSRETIPQVWMVETATGVSTPITKAESAVREFQLSPDGTHLTFLTASSGVYTVNLADGQVEMVMAPTPLLDNPPFQAAKGGDWFWLSGAGLSHAGISVAGRKLVMQALPDFGVWVWLPADLPSGMSEWVIDSGPTPFQRPKYALNIVEQAPRFLLLRDIGERDPGWSEKPLLLMEATGELINQNRPAKPGERLRLYMAGVGRDPSTLVWGFRDGERVWNVPMPGVEPDPAHAGWWIARFSLPNDPGIGVPDQVVVSCQSADHAAQDVTSFPFSPR